MTIGFIAAIIYSVPFTVGFGLLLYIGLRSLQELLNPLTQEGKQNTQSKTIEQEQSRCA